MKWIHANIYGKVCLVFGALALLFTLATVTMPELNDGKPGLLSNIVSALTPKDAQPNVPVVSSMGPFALSEENERALLLYVSVGLIALSLVFSMISERKREFSLYYGVGVLASFNALLFINIPLTVVLVFPTLIVLWYLHRANKRLNPEPSSNTKANA